MRYLILDRTKLNLWAIERITELEDMGFIDEEETLAKFKEVWLDGFDSGFSDGFDGLNKPTNASVFWNEFKETL